MCEGWEIGRSSPVIPWQKKSGVTFYNILTSLEGTQMCWICRVINHFGQLGCCNVKELTEPQWQLVWLSEYIYVTNRYVRVIFLLFYSSFFIFLNTFLNTFSPHLSVLLVSHTYVWDFFSWCLILFEPPGVMAFPQDINSLSLIPFQGSSAPSSHPYPWPHLLRGLTRAIRLHQLSLSPSPHSSITRFLLAPIDRILQCAVTSSIPLCRGNVAKDIKI